MRNLIVISLLLFSVAFTSCTSCEYCRDNCKKTVVMYKFDIPPFPCPQEISVEWETYDSTKSISRNLLVTLNNIEKARRVLDNRERIIACYRENIELYRNSGKINHTEDKEQEKDE